jgi:hypothetical protein
MAASHSPKIASFFYVSTANSCVHNDKTYYLGKNSEEKFVVKERKRRDSYAEIKYENGKEGILVKDKEIDRGSVGEIYEVFDPVIPSHRYVIKRLSYATKKLPVYMMKMELEKNREEARINEIVYDIGKLDFCIFSDCHYILMKLIIGKNLGNL